MPKQEKMPWRYIVGREASASIVRIGRLFFLHKIKVWISSEIIGQVTLVQNAIERSGESWR